MKPRSHRWRLAVASTSLAAALAGCAALRPPPARAPVTVNEIVRMSNTRVPPSEIVARMRASGTVYRLSGSQLARLHDEGVPDPVLDRMQRTYLIVTRRDQFVADQGRWSLAPDGYWHGGLAYGWPPRWLGLSDAEEEYHQPPP
jgi:hypothetical protein